MDHVNQLRIHSKRLAVFLVGIAVTAAAVIATTASSGDTKYKYDALGRVVSAAYPDKTIITYAYDQAGNRTQVVASLSSSSSSGIGGGNSPLTCSAQDNIIYGIPANVTATVTITADQITGLCTASDGATLSVTTPAVPYTFTLNAASTVSTSYSVTDGGTPPNSSSNVITYTRP